MNDTGVGIEESSLEHLFDRFAQAESGHSRRYQGVGLGLAICRELVELMGGKIAVASKPNKGTSFRVTLPVDPADSAHYPRKRTPTLNGPSAFCWWRTARPTSLSSPRC